MIPQNTQPEGDLLGASQRTLLLPDVCSEFGESHDGQNSRRHKGLSKEERCCFRRYPSPSPAYDHKAENYWQSIGEARTKLTETRANTMPNGKGPFWNKPEFKISNFSVEDDCGITPLSSLQESVSVCSLGHSGSKVRRAPKLLQVTHPLDKEEEHLARLLENLFPSTPISKGSSRRGSSKADTISFSTAQGDGKREERKQPTIVVSASAPLLGEREQSPLKTNRSAALMGEIVNPSGGNRLLDNAMKLVKAGKGAVHRDLGGGNMNILEESSAKIKKSSSRKIKKTSRATSGYLLQSMENPNSPSKQQSHPPTMSEKVRHEDSPLNQKSSPKKKSSPDSKTKHSKFENSTFDIRQFRKRLLSRFSSVAEAFNSVDVDCDKKLSLKEWTLVLKEHGLATYKEARCMYELMDSDKDGNLTILEFHIGLETIAPVTSIECLRKRLLCLSFNSMTQALVVMNGGVLDYMERPLGFGEFALALQRINVFEVTEHRAIFDCLQIDGSLDTRSPDARVSISDLAGALAAVSPCLLLEDLRARLTKTFGNIRDAWRTIAGAEMDGPKVLNFDSWQLLATERLHMTSSEASKTFNLIDVDDSNEITRSEFIGAMNVSSPTILLEDARHKVRQGYVSIDLLFRDAIDGLEDKEVDQDAGLDMNEFCEILGQIDIGHKDAERIFKLIDVDHNGHLSLMEFFKGVRLFAPSCRLETVRLQMLQRGSERGLSLADVIGSVVEDRRMPMDRSTFKQVLDALELFCDDADLIFDFLDVRDSGIVAVSEVIAVMQNMQPGTKKMVDPSTRDEKAEKMVQMEMKPFHQTVMDLKRRVKQGLREGTAEKQHRRADKDDEGHANKGGLPKLKPHRVKSGFAMVAAAAATERNMNENEGNVVKLPQTQPNSRLLSASGPPRAGSSQGPQSTYLKLHTRFKQLPAQVVEENFYASIQQLKGYFNSAHCTLQDQRPLLSKNFSRRELHKSTEELKRVTESHTMSNRRASEAVRF